MTERTGRRVRAGLVYLTASFLVVGLWARLSPSSFYEGFPGRRPPLGGRRRSLQRPSRGRRRRRLLAVGLVLLLAAVWMDSRVFQAASGTVLVHDAPHLLFHLRHPNEPLASLDTWMSNGGLAFGMLVALVILVTVSRAGVNPNSFAGARPTPRTSPMTPRAQLSRAIPINKEES